MKQAKNNTENKKGDGVYAEKYEIFKMKDYEYKQCYIDDMLNYFFKSAKELNANGIIGLEIITTGKMSSENFQYQTGYLITGMAIKK